MAEFDPQSEVAILLVTWVVASLFIHFAAKIVLDRSSFLTAMLVALIGVLLARLVANLVEGVWGRVLAIATWSLVCAIFYRTGWIRGAVIGLVAWVLYILTVLLIHAIAN